MRKLLQNRWLTAASELFLGGVFLYACAEKIQEPPDFAHAIYNYKMTPCALINLLAIYLPYVEAAAGFILTLSGLLALAGKRMPLRSGAAALVVAMLLMFLVAIGFNLARGHAVDCGCFSVPNPLAEPKSRDVLIWDMWKVLARDVGMIVLAAQALYARGCCSAPRNP